MMWAHYTNSHKGVCLELDEEILLKNNDLDVFRFNYMQYNSAKNPSIYCDRNLSNDDNINFIINTHSEVLFLKNPIIRKRNLKKDC